MSVYMDHVMNAAAVQRIYATSGDKSSDKEPVLLVEKTGGKKKKPFHARLSQFEIREGTAATISTGEN